MMPRRTRRTGRGSSKNRCHLGITVDFSRQVAKLLKPILCGANGKRRCAQATTGASVLSGHLGVRRHESFRPRSELASAAEAIPLPKAKSWTSREPVAIKRGQVLGPLVCSASIPSQCPTQRVAMVKPSGICACPQWPVGAIPTARVTP